LNRFFHVYATNVIVTTCVTTFLAYFTMLSPMWQFSISLYCNFHTIFKTKYQIWAQIWHMGKCKLQWLNIGKNTLCTSSYKIFKMIQMKSVVSFKSATILIFWIIHVQSLTNFPKSMWKLIFNVVDVILKFESHKRKTQKVQRNSAPSKTLKKMLLGQRNWKINKNCNSYGLMKIWSNFNHSKVPNY
jgi:hypothetical protein